MKKKIPSLILIVAMLLLPFSMLLTVHATATRIRDNIYVDNEVSLSGDSNSKLVVASNEGRATITVDFIGMQDVDLISAAAANFDIGTEEGQIALANYLDENVDSFKLYKILDTYYNNDTNQFSYAFTTSFADFIASLTTAEIRGIIGNNSQATAFTVSDYLALSSDDEPNTTGNNGTSHSVTTNSTLNILASKYAAYIRTNAGGQNEVTGTDMFWTFTTSAKGSIAVAAQNLAAGAYLILPNSVTTREEHDGDMNFIYQKATTYGAMVANLFFTPGQYNYWSLENIEIYSKRSFSELAFIMYPGKFSTLMSTIGSATEQEQSAWFASHDIGTMTKTTSGSGITLMPTREVTPASIPTNAHESIKTQAIQNLLSYATMTLPNGFSYDYTEAMTGETEPLVESNGDYYREKEENEQTVQELVIEPINSSTIKIYKEFSISLDVSNSYAFTAGAANIIKIQRYYIKDAYIDIGSNVTAAEIEAALDPTLQNPTARQQQIQKAFGVLTQELEVYVYGVKVNNTNSSSTNLSGGVFQAYSDSECTTPIGGPFTVTNGVGSFVGISGYDTIYIKQTKAPTGYRLYDKTLYLIPTVASGESADPEGQAFTKSSPKVKRLTSDAYHDEIEVELGNDNYYTVTVQNQPMGFLPFTGGTGTIIYTCIGLLIVVGAVVFLIVYKKKNKKDEEK